MKIYTIILFLPLFFLQSCGVETYLEPDFLNPPGGLIAYSLDNKIKIKFYSSNNESKFDGFNVYISKESSLKNRNILPVKNPSTGGIPTIIKQSKDIIPSEPIEIVLERDSSGNYIENGITYYIIVKAHNIDNKLSLPSNEVSATPRRESEEDVVLSINEGFNIETANKSSPFTFKLIKINGNFYLISENGNGILSKGYYDNWELVNEADESGYITDDTPVLIKEGYLLLVKTVNDNYGKIWITSIDNINERIYFKWAYQKVKNNREI